MQGLLLVATARDEDLAVLGGLAECATVAVRLDEHAAETIYNGLKRRGATSTAHWREAFEQANGLTLEFTHLLTRGQRMGAVIGEQVNRRIQEGRNRELDVLALAATADRWSAEISTADTARTCDMSDFDLRAALERLAAEHLVVERRGRITGLHRLRSTAICEAIHDRPPPTLDQTIRRVIPLIPASQLHRFIAAVLADNPEARDVVIDASREQNPNLQRVAGSLQGLRIADFPRAGKAMEQDRRSAQRPAVDALAALRPSDSRGRPLQCPAGQLPPGMARTRRSPREGLTRRADRSARPQRHRPACCIGRGP